MTHANQMHSARKSANTTPLPQLKWSTMFAKGAGLLGGGLIGTAMLMLLCVPLLLIGGLLALVFALAVLALRGIAFLAMYLYGFILIAVKQSALYILFAPTILGHARAFLEFLAPELRFLRDKAIRWIALTLIFWLNRVVSSTDGKEGHSFQPGEGPFTTDETSPQSLTQRLGSSLNAA